MDPRLLRPREGGRVAAREGSEGVAPQRWRRDRARERWRIRRRHGHFVPARRSESAAPRAASESQADPAPRRAHAGHRPRGGRGAGIRVSCLPRRTLHYTAEHGILLMLALAKRLIASDRAVREGATAAVGLGELGGVVYNWAGMDASGLHGKTLGIIGMGEVGLLTARLARAF